MNNLSALSRQLTRHSFTMQEDRKKELKLKRKMRDRGQLKTRWDNEKEVFNDNEILSVSTGIVFWRFRWNISRRLVS
jgi:hypothetical protein